MKTPPNKARTKRMKNILQNLARTKIVNYLIMKSKKPFHADICEIYKV